MEALNIIASSTTNDIILLIIVLVVALWLSRPLYKAFLAYRSSQDDKKAEREDNLLKVIKGNSTVMAELKTLLTSTNINCKECKTEQLTHFKDFNKKQDKTSETLKAIEVHMDTITQKFAINQEHCVVVLNKLESLVERATERTG